MDIKVDRKAIAEASQKLKNWGRWGKDDQIGTLNHVTPQDVVKAASLIPLGEVAFRASLLSALAAALIALGVEGDVIVPAFSFAGTVSGVLMARGRPVVLDVDADDWVLDSKALQNVLENGNVGAVVVLVPFGIACDLTKQLEICASYRVPVIIDNASGLGGSPWPLPENCLEVYSLHATKPFAIGEGGVIRTAPRHVGALRHALNFGLEHGTPVGGWGINGKLPDVLAAVGLAVLDDFDGVLRTRRAVAQRYIELLTTYESLRFRRLAADAPWHAFPVQFPSKEEVELFIASMAACSVDIRRYYRPSLEDWPGTTKLTRCPNAARLADTMITLPVYSDMDEQEFEVLIQAVRESLEPFAARRQPRGTAAVAALPD
jgi:dTDP-4-amino-4,6-dideoxygalactose transaminase